MDAMPDLYKHLGVTCLYRYMHSNGQTRYILVCVCVCRLEEGREREGIGREGGRERVTHTHDEDVNQRC